MTHETEIKREVLSPEQAAEYVRLSAYPLLVDNSAPLDGKDMINAASLPVFECIDDRQDSVFAERQKVGLPGGGLGVLMAAFAGINSVEKKIGRQIKVSSDVVASIVEEVIGVPSYHTDEKNLSKSNAIPCEGCGHCAGALKDPEKYLLKDSDAQFLKGSYLEDLFKREQPYVYKGEHTARAVMIIVSPDIGMSSVSPSGEHVYVYHKSWHEKVITEVAKRIFEKLSKEDGWDGLSSEDVSKIFFEAAQKMLKETTNHLAADLPSYVVGRGKDNIIETRQLVKSNQDSE